MLQQFKLVISGASGGASGGGTAGAGGSPVDRALNYLWAVEANLQNKFPNIHFDGKGNQYRNGVLVKDADGKVKGPQESIPGSEAPSQSGPNGVSVNEGQVTNVWTIPDI